MNYRIRKLNSPFKRRRTRSGFEAKHCEGCGSIISVPLTGPEPRFCPQCRKRENAEPDRYTRIHPA